MQLKHKPLMMSSLLFCFLVSCSLFQPASGVSDTYTFFSSALKNISSVLVYHPESYTSSTPIIYLLNGWGAEADAWGTGMDLEQQAQDRGLVFVSLSAGSNSYTNDPNNPDEAYEDYVLEVVSKVESHYDLELELEQRAICGISNGGGGAIYLLSEHPDIFRACGSLSGTVYSSLTQYGNFADRGIRIDVGTEDGVLSGLRWLHNKLDEEGLEHEYYEHPGRHDWTFWKKYAPKQFDYLEALISN